MKNAKEIRRFKSQMKHNPTPSERIFAERLKKAGIVFKTQMILGFYIIDFVIPDRMLAIEIDGRHHYDSINQVRYDAWRTEFIQTCGFEVARLTNEEAREWPLFRLEGWACRTEKEFRSGLAIANNLRSKAIRESRGR